jgi:hypothetical protein
MLVATSDKFASTTDERSLLVASPETAVIIFAPEPFIEFPKIKATCCQITSAIVIIVAGISLTAYFLYRFSIFS